MKNLNNFTKEELIQLLQTILKEHPEYLVLLEAHEKTVPSLKEVSHVIEKEMANHTGSVLKAYQAYQKYRHMDSHSKSFMELSCDFSEYLFEEVETYGSDVTEDLIDITLEVFEDAYRLAVEYKEASLINSLHTSLHSSIYDFELTEAFHDVMSYYGGSEMLDDE